MKVGLDLDNTIVDCDALFRRETERLLGRSFADHARDDLRRLVRESRGDSYWTQIQAEVYGPLYQECAPCVGAIEAIEKIAGRAAVSEIVIISHKTTTDAAGKKYRLRESAMAWVERHLLGPRTRLGRQQVFFTETIEDKRRLILDQACDVFFDDLPDIILPLQNRIPHPILFSKSAANHPLKSSLQVCDWPAFGAFVCHG